MPDLHPTMAAILADVEALAHATAMRDRARQRWLTGDVFTSYVRMWDREVERLEAQVRRASR